MRTTDWLLLFVLSVLWGGTYFFAVIATHSVPPLTLVLLRVALAAMVLVPIVLLMGFRLPRRTSPPGDPWPSSPRSTTSSPSR